VGGETLTTEGITIMVRGTEDRKGSPYLTRIMTPEEKAIRGAISTPLPEN
jgi:hypothetical protein